MHHPHLYRRPFCAACHRHHATVLCASCRLVPYCCVQCAREAWDAGHGRLCRDGGAGNHGSGAGNHGSGWSVGAPAQAGGPVVSAAQQRLLALLLGRDPAMTLHTFEREDARARVLGMADPVLLLSLWQVLYGEDHTENAAGRKVMDEVFSGRNRIRLLEQSYLLSDATKAAVRDFAIPALPNPLDPAAAPRVQVPNPGLALWIGERSLRQFLGFYQRLVRVQPESTPALRSMVRDLLNDEGEKADTVFGPQTKGELKFQLPHFLAVYVADAPPRIRALFSAAHMTEGHRLRLVRDVKFIVRRTQQAKAGLLPSDAVKKAHAGRVAKMYGRLVAAGGRSLPGLLRVVRATANLPFFPSQFDTADISGGVSRTGTSALYALLVYTYVHQDDKPFRTTLAAFLAATPALDAVPFLAVLHADAFNAMRALNVAEAGLTSYQTFSRVAAMSVRAPLGANAWRTKLIVWHKINGRRLPRPRSAADAELIRFPDAGFGLTLMSALMSVVTVDMPEAEFYTQLNTVLLDHVSAYYWRYGWADPTAIPRAVARLEGKGVPGWLFPVR